MILKHSSFHALTLIFSGRAVVSICVLLGFKFSKFIFILVASESIRTVTEVVCTTFLCGRGMCGQFIGCGENQAQIVIHLAMLVRKWVSQGWIQTQGLIHVCIYRCPLTCLDRKDEW